MHESFYDERENKAYKYKKVFSFDKTLRSAALLFFHGLNDPFIMACVGTLEEIRVEVDADSVDFHEIKNAHERRKTFFANQPPNILRFMNGFGGRGYSN